MGQSGWDGGLLGCWQATHWKHIIFQKLCGCMGFSALPSGCSLKCGVCEIQNHVQELLAKQGHAFRQLVKFSFFTSLSKNHIICGACVELYIIIYLYMPVCPCACVSGRQPISIISPYICVCNGCLLIFNCISINPNVWRDAGGGRQRHQRLQGRSLGRDRAAWRHAGSGTSPRQSGLGGDVEGTLFRVKGEADRYNIITYYIVGYSWFIGI